ncbi:MAG: DUF503 domain-containing protein [Firmicutes bacterium]|nr:DUF503 domain-containing protein [Bacillota bacterium]
MIVGIATLELRIFGCQSLKEKRSVINSLIRRLQNKFNAAVAETDDNDLWQKGTIGIAIIGGSTAHAHSQLQSIVSFIESQPTVMITSVETELL